MRRLYTYLKDFIYADFDWRSYSGTLALLSFLLYLSHGNGVLLDWTYRNPDVGLKLLAFTSVIGLPYLAVVAIQAICRRETSPWRSSGPWLLYFLGLAMVVITMWFPFHADLAKRLFNPVLVKWGALQFWQGKRLVFMMLPLILYVVWHLKTEPGLLGLRGGNSELKGYFLILALVLPFVVLASFQEGFIRAYPYYKPSPMESDAPIGLVARISISEATYLLDFAIVEWVYRGFWVIALGRFLGPQSVLPMAVMYCMIHMGKPLGEAISSFFGGYALGAFAWQSKSIWGGIVVHMGIAATMDVMALLHRYAW
jgi:hypothetical protein